MSNYRRNVLVGVTVLASMVMLGWMILRFGGSLGAPFAGKTMPVRFVTERADGLSEGSAILFRGVTVGRVTLVQRATDQIHVLVNGEVDVAPPLPAKLTARIRQGSILGSGSSLVLEATPDSQGDLQPNTEIQADFVGLDFFPPEIKTLSTELTASVKQFREANVVGNINDRVAEVGRVMEQAQQTLKSFNDLVGDPKMRADVQQSLANIREASDNVKRVTGTADQVAAKLSSAVTTINDTATRTQAHIDDLAKLASARLEEASASLKQVSEITTKINEGKGTAGQLINDPKLYAGLVDTTTELNATIKDLQRLIQQWEQEGVSFKLK